MDYYSGAVEMPDYEQNTNFNKRSSKKGSFWILLLLAVVIVVLTVVFIVFGKEEEKGYEKLDKDSYLSSLSIESGVLSPKFDKNVFEYIVVANSDTIKIKCEASSKKAKVEGCNKTLELKENRVQHTIRVEAEDTNVSKYYLTIVYK